MIQFDCVSKAFAGETLLDMLSFIIGKGEKCGLVGRNGSGKSTILKMIIGLESEDKGKISMPKHYRLGYLQQHIAFTQKSALAEAALGLPKGQEEHLYIVETILSGLGFSEQMMHQDPLPSFRRLSFAASFG